ncbi:MAG: cytochrome P450 [Myxococcota bacterium]
MNAQDGEQFPSLPPGPAPVRPYNIPGLLWFLWESRDIAKLVHRRFERYGDLYTAQIANSRIFVVRRPEHVRQVLQTQGSKFGKPTTGLSARLLRRFLGEGLLNSNGAFWRRQRRLINPAFLRTAVHAYAPDMVTATQEAIARWTPGSTVEISEAMMALTLRIVGKALFDHDVRDETDVIARATDAFRSTFSSPARALLPTWAPLPSQIKVRRAHQAMDTFMFGLIDERAARIEDAPPKPGADLMSLLVHMAASGDPEQTMSRQQLRDELVTLMLAGHETTSHAVTWTLYLLGEHPDIDAQVHRELREVLGGKAVTAADLEHLTLLNRVFQESMRLFPPVYVVARMAQEPAEIGGYPIPVGAEVIVWIYWTHRDPRWWPEPLAFRPDRFSPEHAPHIPKGAYVPFAAGTRSCIGKHFAIMEAQLILATILQTYRLHKVPGHPVVPRREVTMSPRHGMPMIVTPRSR